MRRLFVLLLPLLALLPASASATVHVQVATVDVEPGDRVSVEVRVTADAGEPVATIDNDISFDPTVLRLSDDTQLPCVADVPNSLSAFFPQPPDCDLVAGDCLGVRGLVVKFVLSGPLVDRVVYHCDFEVADDAQPGIYALRNERANYSTEDGVEGPALPHSGAVIVARDRIPTSTPFGSATPTGTPTPILTPPRVLARECTGDCDRSGSVDVDEERRLTAALFDARVLASCTEEGEAEPVRVGVAHLLSAVQAREQGCTTATPTHTSRRQTSTRTPPPTATFTATTGLTPHPTETPAATSTSTARPSRSMTRTPTSTRTPRPSSTATRTRARTPSRTATPTRPTRTPTPSPASGPLITFAGIARGDGRLVTTSGDIDGVPVFDVTSGNGFYLVFEGRPGASQAAVGRTTFDEGGVPDLQLLADGELGNGSDRVCSGGVPTQAAADFDHNSDSVVDALNDLGCHFTPVPCILFTDGHRGFVAPSSTVQFCGLVDTQIRFPRGETGVRVRMLDVNRMPSDVVRIVVRVG